MAEGLLWSYYQEEPHNNDGVEEEKFSDAPLSPTRMMISKQREPRAGSAFDVSTGGIPPPPDTMSMKEQRKLNTVMVGIVSGATGLLVGGPIVGVVAGYTCAVLTKKTMKKKEKKLMKNYQKELAELLSPPSLYRID